MKPETIHPATPQGMRQLTKDRFELASKSIAIIGGIISAFVLIATMQMGIAQRAREHRWNQARLAMEFVDAMLSDAQAFDAMRMIDWEARNYQISTGRVERITTDDVRDALNVRNNASLPPNGVYIRESFDRLFHHMGKIERALKSDLIKFDDVQRPLAYYVPILTKNYNDVLTPYMKQVGSDDALDLLQRFASPPPPSSSGDR